MTDRDKVLRALVYTAFDLRGRDGYEGAVERIVTVDALWPLVEYEHAIERARRRVERAEQKRVAALQLLRETNRVSA